MTFKFLIRKIFYYNLLKKKNIYDLKVLSFKIKLNMH